MKKKMKNNRTICVGCHGIFPEDHEELLEGNMCKKCFDLFLKGCSKKPTDWCFRECIKCHRNFQFHNSNKTCNGCLNKEVT